MFARHKFLLVTVTELLKSVLNYRSYPTLYSFKEHDNSDFKITRAKTGGLGRQSASRYKTDRAHN